MGFMAGFTIFLLIGGLLFYFVYHYWNQVSNYLVPQPDPQKLIDQQNAILEYNQYLRVKNRVMMEEGEISDIMTAHPNNAEKELVINDD